MTTELRDSTPEAPPARSGTLSRLFGGLLKVVGMLVLLLAAALGVSVAAGWEPSLNPFAQETIDRSSPAVLRSLEDLAQFHASSGHFEVIVDLEDDTKWIPSWVVGERVLFVGVGSVDSVVSFDGLDEDRITVGDDGTSVTIRLPEPRLEEPHLNVDLSYLYARERGVLNRVGGLFGDQSIEQPVYQRAVERIREAAAADDQVIALGRQNTTAMLEGLLRALGFTSVQVVFE